MTVTGEVILTFYDTASQILINVRAIDTGWSVAAIDTRLDRVIRRIEFGSRERAERYARELSQRLGARQVLAHSFPARTDPAPNPATIRYDWE